LIFFQANASSYITLPGMIDLLHSLFLNPATFIFLVVIVNELFNPLAIMLVDYSLKEDIKNLAASKLVLLLCDVKPYGGQALNPFWKDRWFSRT